MIKEKLYKIMDRDELILHKVGLILGAAVGVFGGLLISDKAAQFQEVIEEVADVETTD